MARAVSALQQTGLAEAWGDMQRLADWRRRHGHWQTRRAAQARQRFEAEVKHGLLAALSREPAAGLMAALGDAVAKGAKTPEAAAAEMLALIGR